MSDIKVGRLYLSNIHGLVKLNDVRYNGLSGEVAIIEDEQGRIHRPSVDFFLRNASICERVEADDTFNDDKPAQTFDVLEDMPDVICPKCGLGYQLYHNRVSIERDGMCRRCFDETKAVEDIAWDMGTDEKCEAILVTVCSKCGSTVPADNVEDPALSRWAARFLKAVKGIEVSK